jgi:hypothetical protein
MHLPFEYPAQVIAWVRDPTETSVLKTGYFANYITGTATDPFLLFFVTNLDPHYL